MIRLFALLLTVSTAHAQGVPSGQSVTLHEVLVDDVNAQNWLRFRFVALQIARVGGDITYERAGPDMEHLCQSTALPYMAEYDLTADMIIISMSDKITEFGVPNSEVTQFFDAFRVENQTCIWEAF
jgi:hypothetical protein